MRKRIIGWAAGVAIGTMAFVPHALAEQWITQTGCEPTLIDGVWHPKVSFVVRNIYPYPGFPVYHMSAYPIDSLGTGAACTALRSEAPETWATHIWPTGLVVWGGTSEDSPYPFSGESLGGFGLVLPGNDSCCFDFYFSGPFEPFAQERTCFECDQAVPVTGRSWGALKAMYR